MTKKSVFLPTDVVERVLVAFEQRLPLAGQSKIIDEINELRAAFERHKCRPLTEEQIDKLNWGPKNDEPMTFKEGLRDFARAIEAAHGIR